jgi:hypothetical protein
MKRLFRPGRKAEKRLCAQGAFLLSAAALLLLSLLSSPISAGREAEGDGGPHAFMLDPERCTQCHTERPEAGRDDYTTVTFVDQIVALCSDCHKDAHFREEHPVEIRPESEVPQEFHLDDYYTMTCATCHDPHGPHEAGERYVPPTFVDLLSAVFRGEERFPTYFLRKPNARGELCLSCHQQGLAVERGVEFSAEVLPEYVGSARCRECHPEIYGEWSKTLHARNFLDAVEDPSAVRARFAGEDPFPPGDIRYTVGEHWIQRYLVEGKRGLMVQPERWSLISEEWASGGGSFKRPWLRYCAGCHTTALNPFDGTYLERGTGCESCHGPGLRHSESTDQFDIVNPSLLAQIRWDMICEACHTSGHDRSGKFRYPVGYRPGEDLMRYFRGLVPKAGQDAEDFKGDGSYEDRHRQFLFWTGRVNLLQGVSCDVCTGHNRPSAEEIKAETELTNNELCGTCHKGISLNYEEHSGHDRSQAGCLDCHPPQVTDSGEQFSIHDHKFSFGTPPQWMVDGVDPCARCHPERGDLPAAM